MNHYESHDDISIWWKGIDPLYELKAEAIAATTIHKTLAQDISPLFDQCPVLLPHYDRSYNRNPIKLDRSVQE